GSDARTQSRISHGATEIPSRVALSTLFSRDVVPLSGSDINLPRPRDLLLGVEEHFLPLRNPAGRPGNGEKDWKHLHRESHGLINQARVEVDVRIQLAAHEIFVLKRDPLELERDLEERILAG